MILDRINSIIDFKKLFQKIARLLIVNYILVSNMNQKVRNSCDYVIFIDNITEEETIGERYILHALMQGSSELKSKRICVVTSKRLEFIPKMFPIVFETISIEEISTRGLVGSISSVYLSSNSNLGYKVFVNIHIVLRGLFFSFLHTLLDNIENISSRGSSAVLTANILEKRRDVELLNYSSSFPVKLEKLTFSSPKNVGNTIPDDLLSIFNSLGLQRGKVLFIFPSIRHTRSLLGYTLPPIILEDLVNFAKSLDFKYIINSKDREICGKYGNCLFLPLEKLSKFTELCGNLVSIRSGNVDFLSYTKSKKVIFYNQYLLNWYLIDRDLLKDSDLLQVYINEDGSMDKTEAEILNFLKGN